MKQILLVEDLPDTRVWLLDILQTAYPGCRVDEADCMQSGLGAVASQRYDLSLIDLGLPDGSGLEVLHKVRATTPDTLCVVTTVMGDDAHIVQALAAGADGYLLKEQPAELLRWQLQQLTRGIPALSPAIARRIMEHFRHTGPVDGPEVILTPREQDVLGLIGRGLRNADVAQDLGLSEHTVASYIKEIYRKLNISTRAEASWHATRLGLTPK